MNQRLTSAPRSASTSASAARGASSQSSRRLTDSGGAGRPQRGVSPCWQASIASPDRPAAWPVTQSGLAAHPTGMGYPPRRGLQSTRPLLFATVFHVKQRDGRAVEGGGAFTSAGPVAPLTCSSSERTALMAASAGTMASPSGPRRRGRRPASPGLTGVTSTYASAGSLDRGAGYRRRPVRRLSLTAHRSPVRGTDPTRPSSRAPRRGSSPPRRRGLGPLPLARPCGRRPAGPGLTVVTSRYASAGSPDWGTGCRRQPVRRPLCAIGCWHLRNRPHPTVNPRCSTRGLSAPSSAPLPTRERIGAPVVALVQVSGRRACHPGEVSLPTGLQSLSTVRPGLLLPTAAARWDTSISASRPHGAGHQHVAPRTVSNRARSPPAATVTCRRKRSCPPRRSPQSNPTRTVPGPGTVRWTCRSPVAPPPSRNRPGVPTSGKLVDGRPRRRR